MRVLLADDNPEVRAALRLLIEQQPGCAVCGEAGDAVQLLALCARLCPDVIVLDAELAGLPAHRRGAALIELAQTLRRLCPAARLAALSSFEVDAKAPWIRSMDAAFLKTDPPDDLLAFLRS